MTDATLGRLVAATLVLLTVLLTLTACAHAPDRRTVRIEQGLALASERWGAVYHARADQCETSAGGDAEELEACFGDWYDADAVVEQAVGYCVALLRAYWVARAAGLAPDWAPVAAEIARVLADLPPPAGDFFRSKGIR